MGGHLKTRSYGWYKVDAAYYVSCD